MGNTNDKLSVYTSHGFRSISLSAWSDAARTLGPDILVPLADLPQVVKQPTSKRLWRMVERTEEWMDGLLATEQTARVFAPILPAELPVQWQYIRYLAEDVIDRIAGLAVYDVDLLPELEHESLIRLPRLSLDATRTPHQLLRQVSLGADLLTAPFLNTASDSGIALTFAFPAPPSSTISSPQPLGINMWSPSHSTSVTPISEGCTCYACTNHHRAYVQHLLNAKEMLGWTLLQMHNYHVMGRFFSGIRETLARGVDAFEEERGRFLERYENEVPEGTGQRPRARGYHFKARGGDDKLNDKGWTEYDKGASTVLRAAEEAKAAESPAG